MFGIGFPEMIVILVVALIVVGPDKLPDLARSLAKGVNELRGAMNQIKESLNEETKVISSVKDDLRKTAGQMKDRLLADDEIGGGPSRPPVQAADVEMEADMAELAERLEEQQADNAAAAAPEDAAAEERVVGRNPVPPPEPAA
ncbi:Sec-independent protein translocase protein TatB [Candidatus Electronema sp. TJ]|uniref:Sec-independent protein translocase protein TatB n=1 Tax=Candidatus Electronema sp. TJ TaxID=3401573 RepID=UPI003AA9D451